ncbi:MAG: asparaginase [Nocardioidaceae bacterium]
MDAPRTTVALYALGGTISMAGGDGGVVTRLTGSDIVAAVQGLPEHVEVRVQDARAVPSASLSFADLMDVVAAASAAVADGAAGVVLTQGTDSLEETAFLVDLLWPHDAPFVLTGAMRNPTLAGADGPANVLAAVLVAADPAARGRGALVVMNDEVHAARHVRKVHSASTAAFASPDLGALGRVVEGEPRFQAVLPRVPALEVSRDEVGQTRIGLHTVCLDDDGALLRAAVGACDGLVVAAMGVGHVPAALVEVLTVLAASVPVVLGSRTGAGPVFARTYGAPGSERDLLGRGLVGGGALHPLKARVLLRLLVAAGVDRDGIAAAFAVYR